jgi:hypothetical protein
MKELTHLKKVVAKACSEVTNGVHGGNALGASWRRVVSQVVPDEEICAAGSSI